MQQKENAAFKLYLPSRQTSLNWNVDVKDAMNAKWSQALHFWAEMTHLVIEVLISDNPCVPLISLLHCSRRPRRRATAPRWAGRLGRERSSGTPVNGDRVTSLGASERSPGGRPGRQRRSRGWVVGPSGVESIVILCWPGFLLTASPFGIRLVRTVCIILYDLEYTAGGGTFTVVLGFRTGQDWTGCKGNRTKVRKPKGP